MIMAQLDAKRHASAEENNNETDTDALPTEARKALPNLETLDFIKEGRNLILYGNPGTGKTHLATALGIAACNAGYSVLFTSVPRLLTQIRECRNAMTLRALENKFERYDMVICDEFGYVSCDKAGAEMLFNHLSLRTDKKTTVITTNLAFNRWDEIIADKVLVTAMVDRLTHKAILLNMTGKSYSYIGIGMSRPFPLRRTNMEPTAPRLPETYWAMQKMPKNASTIHI